MNCTYCPVGTLRPGTTTEVFERGGVTLVVKEIPGMVCWACGESHTTEETVDRLEEMLSAAEAEGAEMVVRRFENEKMAA